MRTSAQLPKVSLRKVIAIIGQLLVWTSSTAVGPHQSPTGCILKVTSDFQGDQSRTFGLSVQAMVGNLVAVEVPAASIDRLKGMPGVRAVSVDRCTASSESGDLDAIVRQYSGAGAVIGVLDNLTSLGQRERASLQKVDTDNGVGFISYVSDDPSSTVIMRNLGSGESDLLQALAYMRSYARTVDRPLVIDMRLQPEAMTNPLFIESCQNLSDDGIHFMLRGQVAEIPLKLRSRLFSVALFDPTTGKQSDRMPYWSLGEASGKEMMLAGSDGNSCTFSFGSDIGNEVISITNGSSDIAMLHMMDVDGTVHSYHIREARVHVTPRQLPNGVVILEGGPNGMLPFLSKSTAAHGGVAQEHVKAFGPGQYLVSDILGRNGQMDVSTEPNGHIRLRLNGLDSGSGLELTDRFGTVVYKSSLHPQTTSVETLIDLSDRSCDLYFLKVSCPSSERTFALMLN